MMKKASFILILIVGWNMAIAQQVGMLSHYFYRSMIYNPAFTGNGEETNVMLINHSQWTGFYGGPQLKFFSMDGNLMEKKVGLGFVLLSDRKGINSRIGGSFLYSYKAEIENDIHLAFGLSFGVVDQTIDYSRAIVEDATDPTLFSNSQRRTGIDGSVGVGLSWNKLEFGAALPQLLGNKLEFVDNTNVRSYYSQVRHFMSSAKYQITIREKEGVFLVPLVLLRFVPNTPVQLDGNLTYDWRDKYWVGVTYKSGYAVATNLGFCLHKQLGVGYSYDFIFDDIARYSGLSHEIMLNFKFGKPKKVKPAPVVPVVSDASKEVAKLTKINKENERRVDSLNQKLAENEKRLNDLAEKMEQQSNIQLQMIKANETQSSVAIAQNKNRVQEENIWLVTSKQKEFKDEENYMPDKGYYVVAGTFMNRDFALAMIKRLEAKGYKNVTYVYHESKKYNYVYIRKFTSKEEALPVANEAKAAGMTDVWILVLVE